MRITLTHILQKKNVQSLSLGLLCMVGAFTLGLETAGEVHPFDKSEAAVVSGEVQEQRVSPRGDVDGSGEVTIEDAILIINLIENIETSTPAMVKRGDTDDDYRLTYKDAVRVLHTLSR